MGNRAKNPLILLSAMAVLLAISPKANGQGPPKITTVLQRFKEFSVINDLFTKYGIAELMNDWGSLTVFVVDNAAMGPITAMDPNKGKAVLMLHGILEWYDPNSFFELGGKPEMMLTTLLMTTGQAHGQKGFVIARKGPGGATIGSAIKGAEFKAKAIRPVHVEPRVLTVIQISEPIIPPGP